MKKSIFIIVMCVFILSFSVASLAENVVSASYDEDTYEFDKQDVPRSGMLAQTGGIPTEVFYGLGAILIVAAVAITLKKPAGQK